ncbi:PAS domain-containing sensor histidine kinase [Desulfovibrio sp. TomC]|uniref:PAS domain-containing sensor histidine kinase n=1 Tax=Desulfovibrio sp. TomC TaxID=1562888 RepID=UPI0005740949|nr:PAS domain S-box protein [Desulfovibrio sp. TomC]KHK02526.1 Histidine kinase [Desulfovibrio sp. TomC]
MEPSQSFAIPWTSTLATLLSRGETWLMERVLAYAKAQGYTAFTSTLVEAWRVSVAGLTEAIIAALKCHDGRTNEYPLIPIASDDPIAAFAIHEAAVHRHRGVTLPMFWGLLKYYKRSYLDLVDAVDELPRVHHAAARDFVAACFERMEFAFVLRWNELSGQDAQEALARENLALTNEKNKYLTVFESITHGLFLLDADRRVENCNTAALRIIGYSSPAGALYYGTARPEQPGVYENIRGRALEELLPWLEPVLAELKQSNDDRVEIEKTVGHGDTARHYNVVIERLHDVSGKFTGKVVMCRDVTDRRKTEIALAQSEGLYRTLIDLMHQGVAILSPDGRIDFANQTLCDMLGRPMCDIVGQPATAFIRQEDHTRFAESLAGRQQGQAEPYELTMRRADGRLVTVMVSPSPLIGPDGDYQGSLEVLTDISQLRQLERQLATAKRLEAIGQLAGGVAHEINTPLQYLSGNLEFAQSNLTRLIELLDRYEVALQQAQCGQALETARQAIETFRQEHDLEMVLAELPLALNESRLGAERVASFVRTIKRFAQSDATGRRCIDVNEAILATIEVAKSVQEYPVGVETDLADNLPQLPCVPGDFNQLLLCLLINATQASEHGQTSNASIRVSSRLEGNAIAVAVSDFGTGIPLHLQDKIFNPFFTTKGVGQGGGQGLSIALSIVEKHKGTIHFTSEPGHGTTFHVTFPLE